MLLPIDTQQNWIEYVPLYDWEFEQICSHQKHDINAWKALVELYGSPVLEIGCGTGRICGQLAQSGYQVSGIDNSALSLQIAEGKWSHLPNLTLWQADMLTFSPPVPPHMIIVTYSTFQYLLTRAEQIHFLLHLREMLQVGGIVGFDICPSTCDMKWEQKETLLYKRYWEEKEALVSMYTSHRIDPIAQITRWVDKYEILSNDGVRSEITHRLSLKGVRRDYFELLLEYCGFDLLACYGDFNLGPVTEQSENLLFIARKSDKQLNIKH